MRTSRLGHSAVEVTQLGFGGGPLGGLFAPLDDDTAAGALAAAWDCGIRYYDTSPHYSVGSPSAGPASCCGGSREHSSVLAVSIFNSGVLATPRPVSTTSPPHRSCCGGRIASPMSARRTG